MTISQENNKNIIDGNEDVFLFPASYGQKRMWFLDQFEPGSPYYNIPVAFKLKGRFDQKLFIQTIDRIVQRHESLRTTFVEIRGEPFQVINPDLTIEIPVVDLSKFENNIAEVKLRSIATKEARTPFNLSKGPLVRISIIRLSKNEHTVLITMHHIISDGWSMGILVEEITYIYSSLLSGKKFDLPELEIQYADFSEWQNNYLSGEVVEEQLKYWKNKLEGCNDLLELPLDRGRKSIYTNNGNSINKVISKEIIYNLQKIANSENASLFMILISAFNILLSRYSGQEDINIGTPIANRTSKEIEKVIGLFINTLVIRTDLNGKPTFRELLKRVKQTNLEAFENQDLPFELLVDSLQPDRNMSYSPLFQVMFILQNNPVKTTKLSEIEVSMIDVNMGTATSDITYSLATGTEGALCTIEYNTDLFDESTILKMFEGFETLLKEIIKDPNTRISNYQILDKDTQDKILNVWGRRDVNLPQVNGIHSFIENWALNTPDRIAVVDDESAINYNELNRKANRLARYILELNPCKGFPVGIAQNKTINLLVSVLGVLKAGYAYLPLDPSYPADRLNYMINDSEIEILITDNANEEIFSDFREKIVIDRIEELSQYSSDNLNIKISNDDLAYLIYTSGSTGKSKGTMIQHGSLINIYKGWEIDYGLLDRVRNHLQMASFSFDVFGGDWIRALCSGGKLVLVSRDNLLDAKKLYDKIINEEIDIAEFVPAVLRNLILYIDEKSFDLKMFKVLIAGSDIWYVREYKKFRKYISPNTRLINSFGLTETAIDSTFYENSEINLPNDRLVPIGRPFPNVQIYIFDEHFNPTPIGVKGELFIGGISLARGYHKKPELTAEKFIPNKFSLIHGERLYKTGDLARYLSDGNIEFLGRADHQIKLRGFRIELGEIENIINEHDKVEDSIVLVKKDQNGDEKLISYIVTKDNQAIELLEIRDYLSAKLPEYMIPSGYLFLDSFPLTPNGKIDRKGLPEPDKEDLSKTFEIDYVAPRNETEEKICEIWREVLEVDKVGITHNFFFLGGHSLLATKVISRIKSEIKIDLPLRHFFEKPTVEENALEIERIKITSGLSTDLKIDKRKSNTNIPLSFSQERLWFLDQLEPNSPFYNIPETFRIKGKIDIDTLEKSFNSIIERHEVLRTYFTSEDGIPIQNIENEYKVKIELTDLSNSKKQKIELKKILDYEAITPIKLNQIPLFRIRLIKLGDEDHVFTMIIHHIISDDWSSQVIINEIGILYESYINNLLVTLPELEIQYADYAIWQRELFKGDLLESHLTYWKKQLSDIPSLIELPIDKPRPKQQTFNGDFTTFGFSEEVSKKIEFLSKQQGVTTFIILLAVFKVMLYKLSGQTDIVVGTPVANRNRKDLEPLIGLFVNTLALRSSIKLDDSFSKFIESLKEITLAGFSHQDLPFEYIVDAVQPERNLSHSPIFQVMFVYQTDKMTKKNSSGDLTILPMESHSKTAKFDLTLFMLDSEMEKGGAFEFNTDLFEKETIDDFIEYYKLILDLILENIKIPVGQISLANVKEQYNVIKMLNSNDDMPLINNLVHEEFSRIANIKNGDIAVEFENEKMTYGELEIKSNQLANYLIEQGIKTEDKVALCLPRSLELICSIFAVLKAGAAYLPIDPIYPVERINYIIDDSDASAVIANSDLSPLFEYSDCKKIAVDRITDEISTMSKGSPEADVLNKNICYVLYTSGSTGEPKGVLISHEGFLNYLSWAKYAYPNRRDNGSFVHTTLSFDATITSIFPPLLNGKKIVLMRDSNEVDQISRDLLKNGKFGIIKLTPSHLDLLSNLVPENRADELTDAMIVGGENLSVSQIEFWQNNAPNTLIFNEYGPTETVVGCVVYEGSKYDGDTSVPIGRVIPNMEVYVLDDNLNQVPNGIQGELFIGGISLARGYLNKPDLTAEKFIPNPFTERAGDRIYKTGDLVRIQKDGNLIYLGRTDEQVKIRGYRIELDEIRKILNRHRIVKDSAVIIKEIKDDVKILLAFVLSDENVSESETILLEHLSNYLPAYMIPNQFIQIEDIPLTVNGKLDKKQLLLINNERNDDEREFIDARNDEEEILLKIWRNVLGTDRISANDNFFELGGDSILSIQIIAQANKAGLGLLPRHIFEFPTIEKLAKVVDKKHIINAEQGLITGDIKPLPIFEWFFEQDLTHPEHYNQSLMIELKESIDENGLKIITREMIIHHDILRLRVSKENNNREYYITGMSDEIPSYYYDYSSLGHEYINKKIEEEIKLLQSSLNIYNGPMLKVAFFRLNENTNNLLIVIFHHLVIDGVSWRIVMEDFNTALAQFKSGSKIALPPKSTSFGHWTKKLHVEIEKGYFENEYDYWLNILRTKGEQIPKDFIEGENLEESNRIVKTELSPELTDALIHEINIVYKTNINDILISALVMSIHDISGNNDIQFYLEGHGRSALFDEVDLSRTVGWFTSIYPVLIGIESNTDLGNLIKSVKGQLRDIPNDGLGYGILKYLSQSDEFMYLMENSDNKEIIFNYLGQFNDGGVSNSDRLLVEYKRYERSQDQIRSHLIDINGGINNGILVFEFNYSCNLFNKETIENFANLYIKSLEKIILHCQNKEIDSFDENDFEQFGWGEEDISDIMNELDNISSD